MTNEQFIKQLAHQINAELDVPFVSESNEELLLEKLLGLVVPHVPLWVLAFIGSASDGLTDEELAVHRGVIVTELNKAFDVRGVPEWLEQRALEVVVDGILNLARKGMGLK